MDSMSDGMTPDKAMLKKREDDIYKLHDAIKEMIPIMDWAGVEAQKGNNNVMKRYLEKTSILVRKTLDETRPHPVDTGAIPRRRRV
jgi:hypothetical protein